MALELQGNAGPGNAGLTTYFVVWNAVGQVRLTGGATFGTASAANRNAGAISATELGTASGVYAADSPAFPAGLYSYALYQRVGGSPAESDTLLAGPGPLDWDGDVALGAGTVYDLLDSGAVVVNAAKLGGSTVQVTGAPTNITFPSAIPSDAENAAAWGARDLGNGRTADLYLQGLMNRLEFAADGLSFTLYASDDLTPIYAGTSTRLSAAVGGLRGINPT